MGTPYHLPRGRITTPKQVIFILRSRNLMPRLQDSPQSPDGHRLTLIGDISFLFLESLGTREDTDSTAKADSVVYPESLLHFVTEAPEKLIRRVLRRYRVKVPESVMRAPIFDLAKKFATRMLESELVYWSSTTGDWKFDMESEMLIEREVDEMLGRSAIPRLKKLFVQGLKEIGHAMAVGMDHARRCSLVFLGTSARLKNRSTKILKKLQSLRFRFVGETSRTGLELRISLGDWADRKRALLKALTQDQGEFLRFSTLAVCIAVPLLVLDPSRIVHLDSVRGIETAWENREVLVMVRNGH